LPNVDKKMLEEAQRLHRLGQYYLDYQMVTNSLGFHNPEQAQVDLAQGIDYCLQATSIAREAIVKAGGTAKNIHNNAGQRLGVKRFGGQKVRNGEVLVRQTGSTKIAGPGTYVSRNFTIHAAKDGVVTFVKTKKTHFSGRSLPRVRVEVR